jgi:S-adenosylmethionine-diacylgycerolhomoserine-N-methlytransferase
MEHLEEYYRFQSRIYDATRWAFLFGRTEILDALAKAAPGARQLVEIGCGTGHNLCGLAERFPDAQITGIDLSPDMLAIARRKTARFGGRVVLRQEIHRDVLGGGFQVVLFSYSLSMMNPGWQTVLESALAALEPGGIVGVVDFHGSPVPWFRRHMANHHVRMEAHLLPRLRDSLRQESGTVRSAYAGLWTYLIFVGRKGDDSEGGVEQ